MLDEEEKLKKALMKKALGYDTQEVVMEYALDENGQARLTKKKVTKKHVSPDITAMRVLFEKFSGGDLAEQIRNMSDEELQAERARLLNILKEEEDGSI